MVVLAQWQGSNHQCTESLGAKGKRTLVDIFTIISNANSLDKYQADAVHAGQGLLPVRVEA